MATATLNKTEEGLIEYTVEVPVVIQFSVLAPENASEDQIRKALDELDDYDDDLLSWVNQVHGSLGSDAEELTWEAYIQEFS